MRVCRPSQRRAPAFFTPQHTLLSMSSSDSAVATVGKYLLAALAGGAVGAVACKAMRGCCPEAPRGKRVAVLLCGCGVYDGSEVHEAVSMLVHLSAAGAKVQVFAPDADQAEVVDHATGQQWLAPPLSRRNMMSEAARISRGDVKPLSDLSADEFDALVIPGGFGVAKTLCTFAYAGSECTVRDDVRAALNAFRSARKPIGLSCIAPALAARVFGDCRITLGRRAEGSDSWPYAGMLQGAADMGATLVDADVSSVVVDDANKIATTPAYMYAASPSQVFDGMRGLIVTTLQLTDKKD